ncbi:MAG TPA: hypothetical protein VJT72_23010 [Pseudonocardiaceae bacterium]|nr:hypothetical protein [Pseudonocardiaceae bacterium]
MRLTTGQVHGDVQGRQSPDRLDLVVEQQSTDDDHQVGDQVALTMRDRKPTIRSRELGEGGCPSSCAP